MNWARFSSAQFGPSKQCDTDDRGLHRPAWVPSVEQTFAFILLLLFCYHSNTAMILNNFNRPKTLNKLWSRGKFICKMSRGEKDDKGTGEEKYCRKGERVSYCQERRMGNGHMDGWRLISSLQWFRWWGGGGGGVGGAVLILFHLQDTCSCRWTLITQAEYETHQGKR